jgi:hypothetical protein
MNGRGDDPEGGTILKTACRRAMRRAREDTAADYIER